MVVSWPVRQRSLPNTDDTEETRAFLQARVALFWKVIFFLTLFGSCLGIIGTIKAPGVDLAITLGQSALAGTLWWLCRRGERSIWFSRIVGRYGFIALAIMGAFQGRFLLAGVIKDHAVMSSDGAAMTDAYVTMMELMGAVMFVAIRAALIPSRPRRTIVITAIIGAPQILYLPRWCLPPRVGWRGAGSTRPRYPGYRQIRW